MQAQGYEWIIMRNDDVRNCSTYAARDKEKRGASIWHEILDEARKTPYEGVGIYYIQYVQYAWCAK